MPTLFHPASQRRPNRGPWLLTRLCWKLVTTVSESARDNQAQLSLTVDVVLWHHGMWGRLLFGSLWRRSGPQYHDLTFISPVRRSMGGFSTKSSPGPRYLWASALSPTDCRVFIEMLGDSVSRKEDWVWSFTLLHVNFSRLSCC
jgi:hypothetical protein